MKLCPPLLPGSLWVPWALSIAGDPCTSPSSFSVWEETKVHIGAAAAQLLGCQRVMECVIGALMLLCGGGRVTSRRGDIPAEPGGEAEQEETPRKGSAEVKDS